MSHCRIPLSIDEAINQRLTGLVRDHVSVILTGCSTVSKTGITQRGFIMRSRTLLHSTVAAFFLCLLASVAHSEGEGIETGWIELVKGARDSTVGAEVIEIEDGDTADTQKITLAIPKKSLDNPREIEEVLVIGQRPPAQEESKPSRISYEWVSDSDPDNYGLVIRLSRNTNWPIRLYMNSDPGFMR
jgi:hypothetical protein